MAKNQVQFQKGLSLPEFLHHYGSEQQCRDALFAWRWPAGFVCPECGHGGYCEIRSRRLYQCHRCHHQSSVTSGTIFEATKLPLTTWFLGMYLLTQRHFRAGDEAPVGHFLQCGVAPEAQADAGNEGARRQPGAERHHPVG